MGPQVVLETVVMAVEQDGSGVETFLNPLHNCELVHQSSFEQHSYRAFKDAIACEHETCLLVCDEVIHHVLSSVTWCQYCMHLDSSIKYGNDLAVIKGVRAIADALLSSSEYLNSWECLCKSVVVSSMVPMLVCCEDTL